MPCLNEADTSPTCVSKAREALADHGISGEVIVADNGSADGSQEIADAARRARGRRRRARLRQRPEGGIAAAAGATW